MTNKSDYQSQFALLTTYLEQYRALWQVKAFDCKSLPWETSFTHLAEKLWQLNDADIDELDSHQQRLVDTLLPALARDCNLDDAQQKRLNQLLTARFGSKAQLDSQWLDSVELPHFSATIKGRKWQQISAFAQHVDSELPFFEWCAGKGHLGRYLAKTKQVSVHSLEWQQSLCDAGITFAKQWQLPQTFECADVFALRQNPLDCQQHAVALHACGDLHIHLLRHVVDADTQAVSISPCCYHLIQDEVYQPLSAIGQKQTLKLAKHDLQLPLQQSVIANKKQQQLRHQEIAWRLGFDSLQRDISDNPHYLPIPSVKRSQLSGEFSDFCHWAANCKGLVLTADIDWHDYLEQGLVRQRLTRRIDLVAHVFRRMLEHWLVLDRVCYLIEHGYQVQVYDFCSPNITPRNSLIQATKRK
ncbi:methyltransferase [Shewanella intestini]|uniref:Methyltransferase n=1 Tax=Shewanella intestini TaxID=2017544 RepID=A0ABS5HZ15_9GAMM|nr:MULTISPECIES: methyltransferase [Shewanella]MBR9726891.1 methyltransferase [Shewanella intestini]MRG34543.1 methyltransferase [Shewanella sp. XMDDZSB0408]